MTDSLPLHVTRRVSLTKSQLRSEHGAELLSICQSATVDGVVTDSEIEELRVWLESSNESDLPAASLLRDIVGKVIADGSITPVERVDLQRAVESVLPPELRRTAVIARREVEKAERERNRPDYTLNFMVAGCRFEGRSTVIVESVAPGTTVKLLRDRANRFSRHAIAVYLDDGRHIGFVPDDDASSGLSEILDSGGHAVGHVTKLLGNPNAPIPVVQSSFYDAGTGPPVDRSPSESPHRKVSASDWLGYLVLAVIAALLAYGVFFRR